MRLTLKNVVMHHSKKKPKPPSPEELHQSAAQVQLLADMAAYEQEHSIPVVELFGWAVPVSSRWTWEHVIRPVIRT
jgi:hypothetical protein